MNLNLSNDINRKTGVTIASVSEHLNAYASLVSRSSGVQNENITKPYLPVDGNTCVLPKL